MEIKVKPSLNAFWNLIKKTHLTIVNTQDIYLPWVFLAQHPRYTRAIKIFNYNSNDVLLGLVQFATVCSWCSKQIMMKTNIYLLQRNAITLYDHYWMAISYCIDQFIKSNRWRIYSRKKDLLILQLMLGIVTWRHSQNKHLDFSAI